MLSTMMAVPQQIYQQSPLCPSSNHINQNTVDIQTIGNYLKLRVKSRQTNADRNFEAVTHVESFLP